MKAIYVKVTLNSNLSLNCDWFEIQEAGLDIRSDIGA